MPRLAKSNVLFWTYVLHSTKDGNMYVGYTENIKRRLQEHDRGYNFQQHFDGHLLLFILRHAEIKKTQNSVSVISKVLLDEDF